MESTLYDDLETSSKCRLPLSSNIRLWTQENTTTLWSCREQADGLVHYEAMAMWSHLQFDILTRTLKFEDKLRNAKETGCNSLKQTDGRRVKLLNSVNGLPCKPSQMNFRSLTISVVIVLFTGGSGLLYCVLFFLVQRWPVYQIFTAEVVSPPSSYPLLPGSMYLYTKLRWQKSTTYWILVCWWRCIGWERKGRMKYSVVGIN